MAQYQAVPIDGLNWLIKRGRFVMSRFTGSLEEVTNELQTWNNTIIGAPPMSKHPGHLHTIILNLGPNIAPFQQHHADAGRARRVFQLLRDKAARAKGFAESIEMWHNNSLVSSFTPNPPMGGWMVPPPDADGVRRIPERGRKYTSVDATCLAEWERYGDPKDMAGKVRKPKHLPSIEPIAPAASAPDWLEL